MADRVFPAHLQVYTSSGHKEKLPGVASGELLQEEVELGTLNPARL